MHQTFTRVDDKNPGVFQFIKTLNGSSGSYATYMKDAVFMIPTPQMLHRVVDMLNDIPMDSRDTKGTSTNTSFHILQLPGRTDSSGRQGIS